MRSFPHIKYVSTKAVRLLMQLALIIIKVEHQGPGSPELKPGIDDQKLVSITRQFLWSIRANSKEKLPCREKIAALCKLASTEADRLLLKMSVCSCLSGKEAQKRYGVQSAKQRKIDDALEKASEIRVTVLELANVKEKAVFCRHFAMTSHLVIQRMRRATLKKLKELSGFLRQKMKQSFLCYIFRETQNIKE